VKQVVTTCAHCFNTLKNEYRDLGLELEVVHHTQLLNRLVREGKLTPVASGAGAAKRTITYHDPCYLGRHNQDYEPPRELLQVLPGASYVEMERSGERSFCCGAGGARMWMEENIGERINVNRTKEAVGTGADQIAVGCPFCRVMLSDGLTSEQAEGRARDEVEVLDVAQMLLASVKGESATRAGRADSSAAAPAAPAEPAVRREETRAEPEPGDDTQTASTVTETADVGPAAKASGGSSLFDVGADDAPVSEAGAAAAPMTEVTAPAGGSLFDLDAETEDSAAAEPPAPAVTPPSSEPVAEVPAGGSLFDIAPEEPAASAQPEPELEPEAEPTPAKPAPTEQPSRKIPQGGSLFDIAPEEPAATARPEPVAVSDDNRPSGADVSALATTATTAAGADEVAAPEQEPEPTRSTDEESEDQEDEEHEERQAKAKPAADPPQPRTDVDINEGGSLFDL
jgi:hypothetical protein